MGIKKLAAAPIDKSLIPSAKTDAGGFYQPQQALSLKPAAKPTAAKPTMSTAKAQAIKTSDQPLQGKKPIPTAAELGIVADAGEGYREYMANQRASAAPAAAPAQTGSQVSGPAMGGGGGYGGGGGGSMMPPSMMSMPDSGGGEDPFASAAGPAGAPIPGMMPPGAPGAGWAMLGGSDGLNPRLGQQLQKPQGMNALASMSKVY